MTGRRRFGRIRRLPSGRYQARYNGPDGVDRPAPDTFARKTDAEIWLTRKEAEILDGDWLDPDAGNVLLADFGASWIAERPNLRPKTVQTYEGLLRIHIVPILGGTEVARVKERTVRRWRKVLLDAGVGPVTVAKAYRLLKAILNTAVDDGLMKRNPCRIKGAGQEHSPERPVLALADVFALADAFDRRYRLLILLAVFCSLRWGELAALTRDAIDSDTGILVVRAGVVELKTGQLVTGPPKSEAGNRVLTIPDFLLKDVAEHLATFTGSAATALVFIGPKGAQLRRSNFSRQWNAAIVKAGLSGFHFHDLRHTGNQLANDEGASLREMMDRMGHSTTRAALIYQHRSKRRDQKVAAAISARVKAERSGTRRARKANDA
ncbi:MAG TPA: tyrosine-type recombinase/integrase [Streptosporangiaceae bacterium]|nr:tyrosine-type recombinase/integrase [Streptosporangiaceae bacterium]